MHSARVMTLKQLWPGALLLLGSVLLVVLASRGMVLPWFQSLLFVLLAGGAGWLWYRNRQYRDTLKWATVCLREQHCTPAMPSSTPRLTMVRQFRSALRDLLYGRLAGQSQADNVFSLPARQARLLARTVVDIQQDLELQQAMLELLERCLDSKPGVVEALGEEVDLSLHSVLAILEELAEQTDRIALNAAIEAARSGERSENIVTVTRETGSLAWKIRQYVGEISEAVKMQDNGAISDSPPETTEEIAGQALALLRQLREISRQTEIRLDQLRNACSGLAEQHEQTRE
ncbi:MAG: methyl-accepting chemotaxis protein [Thiohalophilus sp.]|uniref:methyl-accepting chemotaxis protein n=1 Tax=Thiohalophilus sp. TaxID=3028392 RepID=UPI0028702D71|nr:methyl-accepting chemotaxis protein [Thiohalophilus sp.]MDR9435576.1 methyl-accepting chemotaxis protein [Thiohalophilus sp.]